MRTLLIVAAVIAPAIFGLATVARAEEPRPFDQAALPHDEAGLRDADSKQLRLVRRATNQCNATEPAFVQARATMRPCIISAVDHAVDSSDDPALKAYHAALPFNARYDRFRPANYYQQIFVKYAH